MNAFNRYLFLGLLLLSPEMSGALTRAAELTVVPEAIDLTDAFARRQVLLTLDGLDVTRQAKWSSLSPNIVGVSDRGYVTPSGDGEAVITATVNEHEVRIPVRVTGLKSRRPVDFASEIVPLLSRYGCNAGGCHGKASGQNGFKLSLFGFDTAFDYQAIVQEARGRRVFASSANSSLLIQKAIGAVPHGGGQRFDRGDEAYRLFVNWIEAGALPAAADAPRVAALRIVPGERLMRTDQEQQLCVIAEYSDGSTRDVTRQSDFDTNLDVVARVDPDGLVIAGEQTG